MRSLCFRMGLFGALGLALANESCSSTSTCSRREDTIDVYSGRVNAEKTFYESSKPHTERFAYFPPNRTLVFHFGPKPALPTDPPVGLLDVPSVSVFLSFSEDPDSTYAPAAGNQSLIRVRTADRVEIRNDTCSDFYVWLTASTSATPLEPIDGGASTAAGSGGEAGAMP